jgi:hypothetical protein
MPLSAKEHQAVKRQVMDRRNAAARARRATEKAERPASKEAEVTDRGRR